MLKIVLLFYVFLYCLSGFSQTPEAPVESTSKNNLQVYEELFSSDPKVDKSLEEIYLQGVKAYQEKDFQLSESLFAKSVTSDPYNKFILYNLGLAAYKTSRIPLSVAALKRALYVDPGFQEASEALSMAKAKLQSQAFISDSGNWESFKAIVLDRLGLNTLLTALAIFLLCSGFLLIRHFAQRKVALEDELPLPPFPTVATTLSAITALLILIAGAKAYDLRESRAVVLPETVDLFSSPDNNSTKLFELLGGLDVVLIRTAENWAQVKYPGGPSGWVPKSALFHTSGPEF